MRDPTILFPWEEKSRENLPSLEWKNFLRFLGKFFFLGQDKNLFYGLFPRELLSEIPEEGAEKGNFGRHRLEESTRALE